MKKVLSAFAFAAVASGVLAYPLAGHAFWISHSYASCVPNSSNQVSATGAYWYRWGTNPDSRELSLTCQVDEQSDRLKNSWKAVSVKVRDYSSGSSVRVMACLESESGSGGGCGATSSSKGSTGAIELVSLNSSQLGLWVSGSGYATLHMVLPSQDSGKSASSLIGYYPSF
jgi:hypothetical protein